ncbi:MAG: hypothetical protein RLZZ241_2011 [Bacteroidota bacterium]
MSADSGLKTFRDADGLWEGYPVAEVATPEAFARNPNLVLDFYNQRRKQLLEAIPNPGHKALAKLESHYNVQIITQNVDDLHERGGSTHVLHLHGELLKVRSTGPQGTVLPWKTDLLPAHRCTAGYPLRPHIVWFGEAVPLMNEAIKIISQAQKVIVIGTSLQVYPAAGLLDYIEQNTPIYLIDPNPQLQSSVFTNLKVIREKAAIGVPTLVDFLNCKACGCF